MEWGFSEWGNGKRKCGKRKWEERIEEWWKSKKAEKRKYIECEIRIHTPGPWLMRIHLVRNSTSANFGKTPKIFT